MRSAVALTALTLLALSVSVSSASIIGTFVEADESNTASAAGGAWGTTDDNDRDNLWETDQGKYSTHASWEIFSDHDVIAAYGATETPPTIVTTIGDLTPGVSYEIRLLYGSHTLANHKIQGGLAVDSLMTYDNATAVAVPGTLNYEDGYMDLHQVLLGSAVADSSGQIRAYVAATADAATQGRAVYDGLSYQAVPEPGTVTLIGTAMLGLLAYAWRRRK